MVKDVISHDPSRSDTFDLAHPETLAPTLPSIYAPDAEARRRTVEFFTAHIRNANTRKAYAQAGADFSRRCAVIATPTRRWTRPACGE